MKKFKISWKQFLITILTIIILGTLVYFLEKDWRATPVIEGLKNKNKENLTDLKKDPLLADKTLPDKQKSKNWRYSALTLDPSHNLLGATKDKKPGPGMRNATPQTILDDEQIPTQGAYKPGKGQSSTESRIYSGSQNETIDKDFVDTLKGNEKPKKEAFTNLNFAPIASLGKSSCPDPLSPYQNYECGPTNITNFFGNIKFKPECCGNPAGSSYSNSVGCACICPEQWNFLNSRGGNRTFPTEF